MYDLDDSGLFTNRMISKVEPSVKTGSKRAVARCPAADPMSTAYYSFASYTRLNGVSVARRNLVKPPSITTLRMRASPDWAPRHSPTSCAREAGVQIMVDAE